MFKSVKYVKDYFFIDMTALLRSAWLLKDKVSVYLPQTPHAIRATLSVSHLHKISTYLKDEVADFSLY